VISANPDALEILTSEKFRAAAKLPSFTSVASAGSQLISVMSSPVFTNCASQPRCGKLISNPDVVKLANSRAFATVMEDSKFREAVRDDAFASVMENKTFTTALQHSQFAKLEKRAKAAY